MNDLEGRERHSVLKALSIAIQAIDAAPERQRPASDREDMAAMLERMAPTDAELEMYVRSAGWNLFGNIPDDLRRD